jgi:hypothetical protein
MTLETGVYFGNFENMRKATREKAIRREQARKLVDEYLEAMDAMYEPLMPKGEFDPDLQNARKFHEACSEVLLESALSARTIPPDDAFQFITKALNRNVTWSCSSEWPRRGYPWQFTIDPMRRVAELLLRYLTLIERDEPVHQICRLKGCKELVFGGRGNKVFCCDAHRDQWWSYRNMKKYYDDKQEANREQRRKNKQKKLARQKSSKPQIKKEKSCPNANEESKELFPHRFKLVL